MRVLSENGKNAAEATIMRLGRDLEKARYASLVGRCDRAVVLNELVRFQNGDSGFGQGLEPDFQLPGSSPLATSIALQILSNELKYGTDCACGAGSACQCEQNSDCDCDCDCNSDCNCDCDCDGHDDCGHDVIRQAIAYLESCYDTRRQGWYAVPCGVNDFPHAPWWHFDPTTGLTPVDTHWGNPTAELVGYLYRYRKVVRHLDVEELVDTTIEHFLGRTHFPSEHEIYCFIRLFCQLPSDRRVSWEDRLTEAVQSLVCTDPGDWVRYTPQPLHFVSGPQAPRFGLSQEQLDVNLDYLADSLEKTGMVSPNWEWGQYETAWEQTRQHWSAILTLTALMKLIQFGRVS